jgi:calcineurin-like phosphoesterase family protein
MANIYFTSDLHLDHTNIIKYCKRPFSSGIEMTDELIIKWNTQVNSDDLVFILGDFLWGKDVNRLIEVTARLNGKKILIRGNHDQFTDNEYLNAGFLKVLSMTEFNINGYSFILCHYQMMHWNNSHHGSFHLYGHQHDKKQYTPNHIAYQQLGMSERKMNVCMDSNNFKLFSIDEIITKLKERPTNWWREK